MTQASRPRPPGGAGSSALPASGRLSVVRIGCAPPPDRTSCHVVPGSQASGRLIVIVLSTTVTDSTCGDTQLPFSSLDTTTEVPVTVPTMAGADKVAVRTILPASASAVADTSENAAT